MLRASGSKTLLMKTSRFDTMFVKKYSRTSVGVFNQEGGLHEEIIVEGKRLSKVR